MILRYVILAFCSAGLFLAANGQSARENLPQLPALTDVHGIRLNTQSISFDHTWGQIGPDNDGLSFSQSEWQHLPERIRIIENRIHRFIPRHYDGYDWIPDQHRWQPEYEHPNSIQDRARSIQKRINLDGTTHRLDSRTYAVSVDGHYELFDLDNQTFEFSPHLPTTATLENLSGSLDFAGLVFTARDGTVYRFAINGPPLNAGPLAGGTEWFDPHRSRLWKAEYPNGKVVEYFKYTSGFEPNAVKSNLGYQLNRSPSLFSLFDLGQVYCPTSTYECTEINRNQWPKSTDRPRPLFRVSEATPLADLIKVNPEERSHRDLDEVELNFASGRNYKLTQGSNGLDSWEVHRFDGIWKYKLDEPWSGGDGVAEVTDPAGVRTVYTFHGSYGANRYAKEGKLLDVTVYDPNSAAPLTTTYDYYTTGLLQRVTHPEGNSVEMQYDGSGRVTEIRTIAKPGSGLADMVQSYTYDACVATNRKWCSKPRTYTNERGQVTKYRYFDAHGGIDEVQMPFVPGTGYHKTKTEYGQFHAWYRTSSSPTQVRDDRPVWRKTKEISCVVSSEAQTCSDAGSDTKVTEYLYEQGHAGKSSNVKLEEVVTRSGDSSVSTSVRYTYDSWGRIASEDGPLPGASDTVWYEYNNRGNRVRETRADPDGSGPQRYTYTQYTYNLDDQVTQEATGWTTNYTAGRTDTQLSRVDIAYDSHGREIRRTVYNQNSAPTALTQTSYDLSSRVDCVALRMDTSTYGSLPASACAQTASGQDRITKTEYDDYGRAYKSTLGLGTAVQISEETGFTQNGLTQTRIDANGNVTTYEYDGHDRLFRTRYPNKTGLGSSATDYDSWTYLTENGRPTSLHASRRYRDGQVVSYQYDALSRLTLTDAPGTVDDVSQTYDVFGNLETQTKNGQTLTYDWDALGRLKSEQSALGTVRYLYDAAGRRTRTTYPDNAYIDYTYTGAGGVDLIRENGSRTLVDYDYDAFGRGIKITRGNSVATDYAFNPENRLSALDFTLPIASSYNQGVDFGYNTAAQITSKRYTNNSYWPEIETQTRNHGVNGLNQLTDENGTTFTYTDRGSLTGDSTSTYGYDIYNQLTSVDGFTLEYDAAGRLSRVTSGTGIVTQFLYDGTSLIGEYDGAGTLLRRYVHGPGADAPLVWYDGAGLSDATRRYLIADERGSIVLVTNNAGQVVQQNKYDPYGEPDPDNLGRFQYTGQMWLEGTELYHYKARAYAPRLGRFLQTDPIGYEDGLNWYAYVGNDPMNATDPSGMETIFSGGAGREPVHVSGFFTAFVKAGIDTNVPVMSNSPVGVFSNATGMVHVNDLKFARSLARDSSFVGNASYSNFVRGRGEQFNYAGYSHGSAIAAASAYAVAENDGVVDNLILIGAPINQDLWDAVQNHPNILNVINVDLSAHGDPISPGMTDREIIGTLPILMEQMPNNEGHFYYSGGTDESQQRRDELARGLYAQGVR